MELADDGRVIDVAYETDSNEEEQG